MVDDLRDGRPTGAGHRSSGVGSVPWLDLGGTGPSILALHGGTRNYSDWEPVADRLAATHRVVAMDLRGHGSFAHARFALADCLRDIDQVCEEAELRRPLLVGHSLGGIVATSYGANRHGARGVVNVDGVGISIPQSFPGADGPGPRRRVEGLVSSLDAGELLAEPEASIAELIRAVDVFAITGQVRCPALFVLAMPDADQDGDDLDDGALVMGWWRAAVAETMRELARSDPRFVFTTITSGHMVPLEEPGKLADLVVAFDHEHSR